MTSFILFLFWSMGALSIVCACLVAYIGDRSRAHQGMMEGIGLFIVAALLMIATK